MSSRILIIYEYQILYQILNEISESLNFEITQSNSNDLKETSKAAGRLARLLPVVSDALQGAQE